MAGPSFCRRCSRSTASSAALRAGKSATTAPPPRSLPGSPRTLVENIRWQSERVVELFREDDAGAATMHRCGGGVCSLRLFFGSRRPVRRSSHVGDNGELLLTVTRCPNLNWRNEIYAAAKKEQSPWLSDHVFVKEAAKNDGGILHFVDRAFLDSLPDRDEIILDAYASTPKTDITMRLQRTFPELAEQFKNMIEDHDKFEYIAKPRLSTKKLNKLPEVVDYIGGLFGSNRSSCFACANFSKTSPAKITIRRCHRHRRSPVRPV